MTKRSVTPDGESIKRLRAAKGWRAEDLAKKAGCSLKTLVSAENGVNVYIYTLGKIANALKIDTSELIVGEKPPETKPKERVWEIRLTISTPYEDFDETRDLPQLLQTLMSRLGGQELEPKAVRMGSTQVRIDMPLEQVVKLIEAYKDGQLDDLDIKMIQIPDDFAPERPKSFTGGGKGAWGHRFDELVAKAEAYLRTHRKQHLSEE